MKVYGMRAERYGKNYICNSCGNAVKRLKYVYELNNRFICRCKLCGKYISVEKDGDAHEREGREKTKN